MNFISGFILELSGFKEFETFDFIVQFLKSPSRLFVGLYENSFPMLNFFIFLFEKVLQLVDKKRYEQMLKCEIPYAMWLMKWFLTLYTGNFTKKFILRIWDFLMVEDFMGPVYVAVVIILITHKSLFLNFEDTIQKIQKKESTCALLDLRKFVKKLQKIQISVRKKKKFLNEYFGSLKGETKKNFSEIYKRLMFYLNQYETKERKCNSH
jgi:hypothetical protein